jgi:hypothetical protein
MPVRRRAGGNGAEDCSCLPGAEACNSCRVSRRIQRLDRAEPGDGRFFVGRQQHRDQVPRCHLAADLDGGHTVPLRRIVVVGVSAMDDLAGEVQAVDSRTQPSALVARRTESGGLHRGVQLGAPLRPGVACCAVSRSVSGLGIAVGRTSGLEPGQLPALRRRVAGTRRRVRSVLAGVRGHRYQPGRRSARAAGQRAGRSAPACPAPK